MIVVFRETDGVTGDRLTIGESPIDDGQVLIRQGRHISGIEGWTGTFTNGDGDTVTVVNGIITKVE